MGFREKLTRFMMGRYGQDQFGKFINLVTLIVLGVSIVLSFLSKVASYIFYAIALGLMVYSYYRMLSKQIYKRAAENRKFLQIKELLKQTKTHRFFQCPKCKTKVRVPKGKGKICITCPKCAEKFIKKT